MEERERERERERKKIKNSVIDTVHRFDKTLVHLQIQLIGHRVLYTLLDLLAHDFLPEVFIHQPSGASLGLEIVKRLREPFLVVVEA